MKLKSLQKSQQQSLSLKLLFLAYINKYQKQETITDCYNAINTRIQKLTDIIQQNFSQISDIVGSEVQTNKQKNRNIKSAMMDVIQEQQYGNTQRQSQGDQDSKFMSNRKNNKHSNNSNITKKFNTSIGTLQKATIKFQDIMFMYKKQIKQIAKDLTKQREITKRLAQQLKEMNTKDSKDSINREGRSSSVTKISGNKNLSLTTLIKPPLNQGSSYGQSKKLTNYNKPPILSLKSLDSQDQQIRDPPKPFCQQCRTRQKQLLLKQKQQIQQKNKWRQLSAKITNLKSQLSTYQTQLIQKQSQINKLTEEIKKKSEEDNKLETDEKKRLKTMNTNLRGEKIVLENQVQGLRKKNEDLQEYMSKIESQNKKYNIEKDNLQSTVKWHLNTIQDLRKNFSSGLKQDGDLLKKLKQSQDSNRLLYNQVLDQQKYLEQFVQKLKQVEQRTQTDTQKLTRKIKDLQAIIQQKNETIVKMKIGKGCGQNCSNRANLQNTTLLSKETKQNLLRQIKRQDVQYGTIMTKTAKRDSLNSTMTINLNNQNSGFQQNMIKVLNKKLIDRDLFIEKLQKENQILKEQFQRLSGQDIY